MVNMNRTAGSATRKQGVVVRMVTRAGSMSMSEHDPRLPAMSYDGADPLGRYDCLHPEWDPEDWLAHGEPHEHQHDVCPKGDEHYWKFNNGNPVCLNCGQYMPGEPRLVLPATMAEDGTVTVHPPAGADDWQSLERWAKGVFERPTREE